MKCRDDGTLTGQWESTQDDGSDVELTDDSAGGFDQLTDRRLTSVLPS